MADERLELNELQREWRREVSDAMKESRAQHERTQAALQEIRENYAKEQTLQHVVERVSRLETDKAKIIGAALILNFVGGIVLWFVAKLWN